MSKKLRGSYYVDGRRSLTHTTSDDDKLMDVGFRLVHDSQHNISRGGMWSYDREWSAGAYQFNNGWTNSHAALGFRLVVNGRKE